MHVLIAGAGIAGCTLAYCLSRQGIECTIIERSPSLRAEGYMLDFFGAGYDVAEKLDLLNDLRGIHYAIAELTFLDESGHQKFSIPYSSVRKLFDGRHFNFMRGDLERVLYSKLNRKVEVRFGVEVSSIETEAGGCSVMLSDGAKLEGDLLVGADGLHSRVRELCFGHEQQFLRYLHCNTAAYVIEDPPQSLQYSNTFTTLTTPGRQVAIYPIGGGRLATFFLHSSNVEAQPGLSSVSSELHARFGDLNWVVPELLRNINESNVYFDAVAQVVMPAWSRDTVVLVGDAAYCVSLIAGQGASLAMAGAFLLAEELSLAGGNVSDALTRYERILRPAVEKKQGAGRNLTHWFLPNNSLRLIIRDTVLRFSALPFARLLVKKAVAPESVFAAYRR